MKDALELETRRRMFQKISDFPGMYFRELQRALKLEVGEAEYHLSYLEKSGLISFEVEGKRKRYFAKGKVAAYDRRLLTILRQEVPRRIVMEILLGGKRSFQELLDKFPMAKSTLSFHLSKLTEGSYLIMERVGKESYYFALDPERIAKALITFKETFLDETVDRFASAWLEIRP